MGEREWGSEGGNRVSLDFLSWTNWMALGSILSLPDSVSSSVLTAWNTNLAGLDTMEPLTADRQQAERPQQANHQPQGRWHEKDSI